jgi:hypothetical protein
MSPWRAFRIRLVLPVDDRDRAEFEAAMTPEPLPGSRFVVIPPTF